MTPILKWAGGKRWLCKRFPELFPETIDKYVEPFAGGAAAFFSLGPDVATLADLNADLIDTYLALKEDWKGVWRQLKAHQKLHNLGEDYYYIVRDARPRSKVAKAARFIYLNRTCFNGLYRVNLSGVFNVPKGTKDTVIFDTDDFERISMMLQNANLRHADFEDVIDEGDANTFEFVDPPYTVKHNNNGFLKYNEKIFSWSDQERLAKALERFAKRGGKALVTNAAHKSVIKLYERLGEIHLLDRTSVLASDIAKRTEILEIAVTIGYEARPKMMIVDPLRVITLKKAVQNK